MGAIHSRRLWRYEPLGDRPRPPRVPIALRVFWERVTGVLDVVSNLFVVVDCATIWDLELGIVQFDSFANTWWAGFGFLLIVLPFVIDHLLLWKSGVAALRQQGIQYAAIAYTVFGLPAMLMLRIILLFRYPFSRPSLTTLPFPGAFDLLNSVNEALVAPGQMILASCIFVDKVIFGTGRVGMIISSFVLSAYSFFKVCLLVLEHQALERDRSHHAVGLFQALRMLVATGRGSSYTHGEDILEEAVLQEALEAVVAPTVVDRLVLDSSAIDDSVVARLALGVNMSSTLSILSLEGNIIGVNGAAALADCLKAGACLQKLFLDRNAIGADGAARLAEGMKASSHLRVLFLDDNAIGDEGAKRLADGLGGSSSLEALKLSNNSIGDAGAIELARSVGTSSSLRSLNLSHNAIRNRGAVHLAVSLTENRLLESLDLGKNAIGDDGAARLAEGAHASRSLQYLWLDDNEIGHAGTALLSRCGAVQAAMKDDVAFGNYRPGDEVGNVGSQRSSFGILDTLRSFRGLPRYSPRTATKPSHSNDEVDSGPSTRTSTSQGSSGTKQSFPTHQWNPFLAGLDSMLPSNVSDAGGSSHGNAQRNPPGRSVSAHDRP